MARIRTIQPHFSRSPSIRNLSHEARLLFVLLWTVVDDSGRCHAAPDDLAKVLYPQEFDVPPHIELWLDELEREGCIERYEYEEIDYLHIVHWRKHQVICHPTKSYLPAPPREALGGTPHGSPDDSRILEITRKVSGRGRKIPRNQAIEERCDTFLENDDPFAQEAAELASGSGLTPERIEAYLDLALRQSIVANVQASPARYIEMAGKLHNLWGGHGAPAGKKEPQAPAEKRSLSPAEIHGLPEQRSNER
jgi:hypothetical protein